jgi:hypothetical protein
VRGDVETAWDREERAHVALVGGHAVLGDQENEVVVDVRTKRPAERYEG